MTATANIYGKTQTPPLQYLDAQRVPHEPQFSGSDCRFAQYAVAPDLQTMLGGQQYGLMPGGGVRKPGLLSATWPAGQQSFGLLFSRSGGQQIAAVPGLVPMSPARIGMAHFFPEGQQICVSPVTQHERLLGQHPAFPQHREVVLSQHFLSHSS
jgi:hypothetical protein